MAGRSKKATRRTISRRRTRKRKPTTKRLGTVESLAVTTTAAGQQKVEVLVSGGFTTVGIRVENVPFILSKTPDGYYGRQQVLVSPPMLEVETAFFSMGITFFKLAVTLNAGTGNTKTFNVEAPIPAGGFKKTYSFPLS